MAERLKAKSHHHRWIWRERGIGTYEKGKQKIRIEVEGFRAGCDCGKKMFFPDRPNLQPVEIE